MFPKFILLLAVNFVLRETEAAGCPADKEKDWSYDSSLPNGPEGWAKKYPACNGKRQSPINLVSRHSERKNHRSVFLHGYEKPLTKYNIENNGYTVKITPTDGVTRRMEVKGHPYVLQQFHFHWGDDFMEGSEHLINGKATEMEQHFVHQDSNGNYAVVGVRLKVSKGEKNAFGPIVNNLSKVKYAGDKTKVDGSNDKKNQIKLGQFLPYDRSHYKYTGSVTTPPCTENVTWVVVATNTFIDPEQINEFRHLYSTTKGNEGEDGQCYLVNNYRPKQRRNGRRIILYKQQ